MEYRWDLLPTPPQFDPELSREYGKYAAKVLALRGLHSREQARAFVDPDCYSPTPPGSLPDLERAVARLLEARERGETLCIWGDFDCDGVTSTSLLLSALQPLGFQVQFTLPLRSSEGHGLNSQRLQQVLAQGCQVLLTVDCGIGNAAEIALAQAQGVDVIVADHHTLPDPLPPAYAVINPLRLPEDHPLRFLPGVGVAYKLAEALYQALGIPGVEEYLDLVAVGIVADVAVLQRECRYLVQRGLPVLAKTRRPGLRVLLDWVSNGSSPGTLTAQDIAFGLAPKLNAIGRLEDASLAVELLTTSDSQRAQALVEHFLALSEECRQLTQQVLQEATQQLESLDLARERAIVLAGSGWKPGVLGIAAARLAEQYRCPAVLIAKDESTGLGYGSGRSIPGVNLLRAIEAVRPLLQRGGGHPMAVGIQVDLACLAAVQLALRRELAAQVSPVQQARVLAVEILLDWDRLAAQGRDGVAELDEVYRQLQLLQPFGHGNPNPVVALMNFRPSRSTLRVSRDGRHLRFQLQGKAGSRTLWFWEAGEELERWQKCPAVDIALCLEAEERGRQPWWGRVLAVRPAGEWQAPTVSAPRLQVEDYRQCPLPDALEKALYYDGQPLPLRQQVLPSAKTALVLARWPWLPQDLAQLLQQVQPQTLVLAASAHPWEHLPQQLAQLRELSQAEPWDPAALAAATGLPQQWLAALKGPEQIPTQLLSWIRESQAFHRWLDEASPAQIAQLCQRLLQAEPRPAAFSQPPRFPGVLDG
ncbi:single-stranded-DNA-specific exonuclease RecJ [Synechococcus sp. H65.1]|uniref:single-stranded-DNA-specific exonuclease RecJ n=1 Tax=unclassified Synechococcus TaxID=2626047 RepID=UPI0039C1DB24